MAKAASRDRRREVQWRRVVRQHIHSGLTIREFCAKGKLLESTFYFWRRELQRRKAEREQRRQRGRTSAPADPSSKPAFLPVRVAEEVPPTVAGGIEIVLSNGRRLHVTAPVDRTALADVLAVLEA